MADLQPDPIVAEELGEWTVVSAAEYAARPDMVWIESSIEVIPATNEGERL